MYRHITIKNSFKDALIYRSQISPIDRNDDKQLADRPGNPELRTLFSFHPPNLSTDYMLLCYIFFLISIAFLGLSVNSNVRIFNYNMISHK